MILRIEDGWHATVSATIHESTVLGTLVKRHLDVLDTVQEMPQWWTLECGIGAMKKIAKYAQTALLLVGWYNTSLN